MTSGDKIYSILQKQKCATRTARRKLSYGNFEIQVIYFIQFQIVVRNKGAS